MPGNLQSIPASVVVSWPRPNYINPVRRAWMPAYAAVFQAVMTVMLATRIILRFQKKAGTLGLDDALLVPAFIGATLFTVVSILSTEKYGFDRHIWDVPPTLFVNAALMAWIGEMAFVIGTSCTKISVLLFFRRLTEGSVRKDWKYASIGAIIFTVCYGLAFVLVLIFDCTPIDSYWKSYGPEYTTEYHCGDTTTLNTLQGALSILSDLYSVILPMGMLWRLQATKQQKRALNALFSLGLLVVGAGIARTYYLHQLSIHYDITWLGFYILFWSDLEAQLAIICACAPALRVLFRRYLSGSMTRALNSARSTAGRSAVRESKQTDTIAIFGEGARRDLGPEDGSVLNKKVEASHKIVRNVETGSRSPSSFLAGEYESIALEIMGEHSDLE